ncbi:MAG TPA: hypothetical protein VG890_03710 [Puia sp.]|nr:hypothetical protein [Puia sp.]
MKWRPFFLSIALLSLFQPAFSQTAGAVIFRISSPHTAFPDSLRAAGHVYDSVLYSAADHYRDSSVLIVVPEKLKAKKKIDLVCWFHGWRNNIDSASVNFELIKQFLDSKRNAILVFAETAKNAPDSYGGRLEKEGVFKALVGDVFDSLKARKLISSKSTVGNIALAGHSGAYRVMARIIRNGQLPIHETILFDALYGETDIFDNWIKADKKHRFIDLYTDHGGTDEESRNLVKQLKQEGLAPVEAEESAVTPGLLQQDRILFIHSLKAHNDIINKPDNFRMFLENSVFLKPVNSFPAPE